MCTDAGSSAEMQPAKIELIRCLSFSQDTFSSALHTIRDKLDVLNDTKNMVRHGLRVARLPRLCRSLPVRDQTTHLKVTFKYCFGVFATVQRGQIRFNEPCTGLISICMLKRFICSPLVIFFAAIL